MELGELTPAAACTYRQTGSEFKIEVDSAIVARHNPNPMIAQTSPGLQTSSRGTVVADPVNRKDRKLKVRAEATSLPRCRHGNQCHGCR
jgi:hypothetical protein